MRKNNIRDIIAHAGIILSAMFIIFFIIDRINPAMGFISSELSKWLLFVYAIVSMTACIILATATLKRKKKLLNRMIAREKAMKQSQVRSTPTGISTRMISPPIQSGKSEQKKPSPPKPSPTPRPLAYTPETEPKPRTHEGLAEVLNKQRRKD